MRSSIVAAIFLMAALLVSQPGNARPGMDESWGAGSEHANPLEHMERIADHLDLSEEQQATITDIVGSSMQQTAGDREKLRQLRGEMDELLQNFDSGRAHQLTEEMGQLGARMAYAHLETMSRVRAELTEQQRLQMDEHRERREERREKWRQR
jgi:Spy/CpxP family protein refolding chaperone